MASTTMGSWPASIAHEVNQPITGCGLSTPRPPCAGSALDTNLEQVRRAPRPYRRGGTRAGNVIGGIRALVEKAPPRRACLDLNEAIREVIALTRGEAAKTGVSVGTDLAEGLPLIYGDGVELQQVILNLIINAIEAMGGVAETSRTLLMSTRTSRTGRRARRCARIWSGTGSGEPRAFKAFYTTRPVAWGWDWRSAARSSKRTTDSWEPSRMNRAARFFSLRFLYNEVRPFPRSAPVPYRPYELPAPAPASVTDVRDAPLCGTGRRISSTRVDGHQAAARGTDRRAAHEPQPGHRSGSACGHRCDRASA